MPEAATYRSRIAFHSRELISDGHGNSEGAYQDEPDFVLPATVRARLGGEDTLAGRLEGRNIYNITVRQSANSRLITEDWQARDPAKGLVYSIRAKVDPHEHDRLRGRDFELLCETKA